MTALLWAPVRVDAAAITRDGSAAVGPTGAGCAGLRLRGASATGSRGRRAFDFLDHDGVLIGRGGRGPYGLAERGGIG